MKSNRMRLAFFAAESCERFRNKLAPQLTFEPGRVIWQRLPAPLPVPQIDAETIIQDILEATLLRLQKGTRGDIAAAAMKRLMVLRASNVE